jgi:hypothetical protein
LKKRLLVLDLILAVAVTLAAFQVRGKWFEARQREQVVLGRKVKPVAPPPFTPLKPKPPAQPASYLEVAQKMLFAQDRNPTVIVEVAPPKPVPPFPVLYGILDLGDGPAAMMAMKAGAPSSEIHTGQKIGEFKLAAIHPEDLVFEWDGQQFTKKISELVVRAAAPAALAARNAAPPPPPAAAVSTDLARPGRDIGVGWKACQKGDPSPAGTVRDGMKKVILNLAIGQTCRWEPQ